MSLETSKRELTYGEKVVGLDFNPSGDENVQKIKELYAEVIDLIGNYDNSREISKIRNDFEKQAISLALQAQMMAVKAVTCKF